MQTREIWDRSTQSWRRGRIDEGGNVILEGSAAPPEPTQAYHAEPLRHRLWIGAAFRSRADGPGVDAVSFRQGYNSAPSALEVELIFNSTGGKLAEAWMMLGVMRADTRRMKRGFAFGEASSAASLLWLACDYRAIHPDARVLIHDPSFEDGRPDHDGELIAEKEKMLDHYCKAVPGISRQQWSTWMTNEVYFSADDCIRYGLAHATLNPADWQIDGKAFNWTGRNRPWTPASQIVRLAKPASPALPAVIPATPATPAVIPATPVNRVGSAIQLPAMSAEVRAAISSRGEKPVCQMRNAANGVIELEVLDEIGSGASTPSAVAAVLRQNPQSPITVRINSAGGDAFAGVSMFNMLVSHGGVVTTVVESLAGSAASLIAMAGSVRKHYANSSFFVHRAAMLVFGNIDSMEEAGRWLKQVDQLLAETYATRTGRPVMEMMRLMRGKVDGTVFTASESLKLGFATEIIATPGTRAAAAMSEADVRQRVKTLQGV